MNKTLQLNSEIKKFNIEGVIEEVKQERYRVRYGEHSVTPFLQQAPLGVGQFHLKSPMIIGDKVLITHVEHGLLIPVAEGGVVMFYDRENSTLQIQKPVVFKDTVMFEQDVTCEANVEVKGNLIVDGMNIKQTIEAHTHSAGSLMGQSKVSGITGIIS